MLENMGAAISKLWYCFESNSQNLVRTTHTRRDSEEPASQAITWRSHEEKDRATASRHEFGHGYTDPDLWRWCASLWHQRRKKAGPSGRDQQFEKSNKGKTLRDRGDKKPNKYHSTTIQRLDARCKHKRKWTISSSTARRVGGEKRAPNDRRSCTRSSAVVIAWINTNDWKPLPAKVQWWRVGSET